MKKQFQFLIISAVMLFSGAAISAQTRISFKRGATSAVVTGYLNGYRDKKVFVIRVRRGQTLQTAQVKSDSSLRYITVYVEAPNGEGVGDSDASCNSRREIEPTKAGDYKITVVECQKADRWRGNFRLKVTVR